MSIYMNKWDHYSLIQIKLIGMWIIYIGIISIWKKYEDYFHLNGKCNSTHQNSLEYLKYFTLFKMIGNRKYENVFLEVSQLTNSMFTEFQIYTFQLQRFIFIETPVDLLF